MAMTLYELAGNDGARFSPYCWRARMAIAHKGLDAAVARVGFTDIASIAGGGHKSVPVLDDGGTIVDDSWEIAVYLDEKYPDLPSLLGGPASRAHAKFIESWANATLQPSLITLLVKDIYDHLSESDKVYFRETREKRFGKSLEDLQAGREERLERVGAALQPLRLTLSRQAWLGGEKPTYADHIVFGSLQWPRVVSAFPVLDKDGPVPDWFNRCLDLYGGVGREEQAAAA